MEDEEFIPVYAFAKKHGVTKQSVYRWVRESKIPDRLFKRERVLVEKIKISTNYVPPEIKKRRGDTE